MTPAKLEKIQGVLKAQSLDGLLILNYVDFVYFTGSIQGNLLFIPASGTPLFFTRRALDRTQKESAGVKAVGFKSFKEISAFLPDPNGKYGFLLDSTPASLFQKVCEDLKLKPEQIIDFSGSLKTFKMVKEAYEIDKIRKAGEIIEKSYRQWQEKIKPGMSEIEAAILLESLLRENGHLGENRFRGFNQIGLNTYVVSGENVYTPAVHDTPYGGAGIAFAIGVGPSHKKILAGEPFMADSVASFEGYHNDCTRTFIFGKPSDAVKKHYEGLKEIYHTIQTHLKPGVVCEEVYSAAVKKAKDLGYENNFMGIDESRVGFIGHGIGIQVDEFPVFAPKFKTPLQPGMTVAVEPKLFLKEIGGVGLETSFLITEGEAKPLCALDEELRIIEI